MSAPSVEAPAPTVSPLSAIDRCDRCGAQALVEALVGSTQLLFCGHHFKAHEAKLNEMNAVIGDYRDAFIQAEAANKAVGAL